MIYWLTCIQTILLFIAVIWLRRVIKKLKFLTQIEAGMFVNYRGEKKYVVEVSGRRAFVCQGAGNYNGRWVNISELTRRDN
jgi:hypothetical protein